MDMQKDVCARFGFRLEDLPAVLTALKLPYAVRLRGGHVMTGEEAALIALRRFRTAGALCKHAPRLLFSAYISSARAHPDPLTSVRTLTSWPLHAHPACSGRALTYETGRSEAAISEAHTAAIQHIHMVLHHLGDCRSFAVWAPRMLAEGQRHAEESQATGEPGGNDQ
jgi:hypothetical protein